MSHEEPVSHERRDEAGDDPPAARPERRRWLFSGLCGGSTTKERNAANKRCDDGPTASDLASAAWSARRGWTDATRRVVETWDAALREAEDMTRHVAFSGGWYGVCAFRFARYRRLASADPSHLRVGRLVAVSVSPRGVPQVHFVPLPAHEDGRAQVPQPVPAAPMPAPVRRGARISASLHNDRLGAHSDPGPSFERPSFVFGSERAANNLNDSEFHRRQRLMARLRAEQQQDTNKKEEPPHPKASVGGAAAAVRSWPVPSAFVAQFPELCDAITTAAPAAPSLDTASFVCLTTVFVADESKFAYPVALRLLGHPARFLQDMLHAGHGGLQEKMATQVLAAAFGQWRRRATEAHVETHLFLKPLVPSSVAAAAVPPHDEGDIKDACANEPSRLRRRCGMDLRAFPLTAPQQHAVDALWQKEQAVRAQVVHDLVGRRCFVLPNVPPHWLVFDRKLNTFVLTSDWSSKQRRQRAQSEHCWARGYVLVASRGAGKTPMLLHLLQRDAEVLHAGKETNEENDDDDERRAFVPSDATLLLIPSDRAQHWQTHLAQCMDVDDDDDDDDDDEHKHADPPVRLRAYPRFHVVVRTYESLLSPADDRALRRTLCLDNRADGPAAYNDANDDDGTHDQDKKNTTGVSMSERAVRSETRRLLRAARAATTRGASPSSSAALAWLARAPLRCVHWRRIILDDAHRLLAPTLRMTSTPANKITQALRHVQRLATDVVVAVTTPQHTAVSRAGTTRLLAATACDLPRLVRWSARPPFPSDHLRAFRDACCVQVDGPDRPPQHATLFRTHSMLPRDEQRTKGALSWWVKPHVCLPYMLRRVLTESAFRTPRSIPDDDDAAPWPGPVVLAVDDDNDEPIRKSESAWTDYGLVELRKSVVAGKTLADATCPICCDAQVDVMLECGHTFCLPCAHNWRKQQQQQQQRDDADGEGVQESPSPPHRCAVCKHRSRQHVCIGQIALLERALAARYGPKPARIATWLLQQQQQQQRFARVTLVFAQSTHLLQRIGGALVKSVVPYDAIRVMYAVNAQDAARIATCMEHPDTRPDVVFVHVESADDAHLAPLRDALLLLLLPKPHATVVVDVAFAHAFAGGTVETADLLRACLSVVWHAGTAHQRRQQPRDDEDEHKRENDEEDNDDEHKREEAEDEDEERFTEPCAHMFVCGDPRSTEQTLLGKQFAIAGDSFVVATRSHL